MNDQDFTTAFTVDATAHEVFTAVNDVRGWWSESVDGDTDKLGDTFTFHVPGIHRSVQELVEVVPDKLVIWRVIDADLTFVADPSEWKDTEIRFELTETDGGTEVRFRHVGLVPAYECFDVCSNAWADYINGSLRSLITTGEGQPIENEVENNTEHQLEPARA